MFSRSGIIAGFISLAMATFVPVALAGEDNKGNGQGNSPGNPAAVANGGSNGNPGGNGGQGASHGNPGANSNAHKPSKPANANAHKPSKPANANAHKPSKPANSSGAGNSKPSSGGKPGKGSAAGPHTNDYTGPCSNTSDPDGMANGGVDKPGGQGGVNPKGYDCNNGSGNDPDCEDDNKGRGVPGHCKDRSDTPDASEGAADEPESPGGIIGAIHELCDCLGALIEENDSAPASDSDEQSFFEKILELCAAAIGIVDDEDAAPAPGDSDATEGDDTDAPAADAGTCANQSDPDGMENGGMDKPGEVGGISDDKDCNNGSGNDDDCEDDNNGNGLPGRCAEDAPETPEGEGCSVEAPLSPCMPGEGDAPGAPGEGDGENPAAAKVTLCHATGSATNPFVEITISENGLNGHADHEGDLMPIPAGGCPVPAPVTPDEDTDVPGAPSESEKGKVTLCHATGSATNPFVEITISENGLNGHGGHEGDIMPVPAGGCPVATTQEPGGETPTTPEADAPGGETPVTPDAQTPDADDTPTTPGADATGEDTAGDEETSGASDNPEGAAGESDNAEATAGASDNPETLAAAEADQDSELPFTGLALGLLVLIGGGALTAGYLARRKGSGS